MPGSRRKKWIGVAVASLMCFATVASGAPTESHEADTLFNLGYDEEFHIVMWNTSSTDSAFDCTLANGALTVTYGEPTDDTVPVDELDDGEDAVSFENRDAEDVGEDFEPAEEPVDYSGADGECGLSGAEVSGPNGQVNHGMFMKLFNATFEGKGRGCLNRHLAQSDLGKGDQQLKVSDVDPDFISVVAGDSSDVEFMTFEAICEHGNKKDSDDADGRRGRGKPESPGKSGDAPGHNKNQG